jgi:hypothetical protein
LQKAELLISDNGKLQYKGRPLYTSTKAARSAFNSRRSYWLKRIQNRLLNVDSSPQALNLAGYSIFTTTETTQIKIRDLIGGFQSAVRELLEQDKGASDRLLILAVQLMDMEDL